MTKNTNLTTIETSVENAVMSAMKGFMPVATSYQRKDGTLGYKAVYQLKNTIGKGDKERTTLTTMDRNLIEANEKILYALHSDSGMGLIVCRELYKLSLMNIEDMGFKDINGYAKALFDLSAVTVRQYIKIGEYFITDDYRINSEILPPTLTKGHLLELLTLCDKDGVDNPLYTAEKLFEEGIICDGMSTMKMRKALKEWKKGVIDENAPIDTEGKEVNTASETGNEEEAESSVKDKINACALSVVDMVYDNISLLTNDNGDFPEALLEQVNEVKQLTEYLKKALMDLTGDWE